MWRPVRIVTMTLGAIIGGAVAAGLYVLVGTLIESAMLHAELVPDIAVIYGLIGAVAGAIIGLVCGVAAAAVVVSLRRSRRSRARIWWATLASVVAGTSVLAWMFGALSSIEHNLALIGAGAILITLLASIGLTLCERRQRARITRAHASRRAAQAAPRRPR
ncbi:hypothetical protein [Paramicrobacterium chengjingii]|uniref:Major facilitator superfamily (MFS) profile domain-containing protein n=1 Tax=Paramicrobacterium chengjingii TaxID=2769067 RepID=A0ABX6YIW8_9MICO|nr:hypothetical protein [Microbacterium chengjingii]QPZ38660.1 hypothetical protein HCR76_00665 [Microbacterium chengjingii]